MGRLFCVRRPIGVFDSGVGGLSVLAELRAVLPEEDFVFFGDNGNAPYGEREEGEIVTLTLRAVDILLARGVKALVLACNTATSAAAATLRARLAMPVVGMEPALKPAQALRRGGQILVMATPATLRLPKFGGLMTNYGEGAIPVPVQGLVELIQQGEVSGERIESRIGQILRPYRGRPVDAIVLGCTHYIFAREAIARVAGPDVALVDGNRGTALQLRRLLARDGLLEQGGGGVVLLTSGDEAEHLPIMKNLLALSEKLSAPD